VGPPAVLIPPRGLRIAAAAYEVERLADRAAVAQKLDRWIADAAGLGADLLAFPEYAGMEAALAGTTGPADATTWCRRAAASADWLRQTCAALAARHGVHLLTGSLPTDAGGGLVNRAWLIVPDGAATPCDKRILTPWERRETPLVPGRAPVAIDTGLGRIGALICYDAEFPLLARRLSADILLVPSCTDLPAGDARVRVAARARALEGQAVVVQAPLLGAVPECPLVDANTGAAGIYAAPDAGWPDDGVLARGDCDRPGWTCADIAEGRIGAARRAAAVDVPGHWPESAADCADTAAGGREAP